MIDNPFPCDIGAFGRRRGLLLVGLLYGAVVLGGLGPPLPPVRLVEKFFKDLLTLLGFCVGPQPIITEKKSDQVLRDRKGIGVSSLLWTA